MQFYEVKGHSHYFKNKSTAARKLICGLVWCCNGEMSQISRNVTSREIQTVGF